MSTSTVMSIAIGVLAVVFVLYRQLRTQPLLSSRMIRMPLIMAAIGVVETALFLRHGGAIEVGHVIAIIVGLIVAAVLAYPRAMTMKAWRSQDGTWLGRGTVWTVLLWFVTVGAHVAVSLLVPPLFGEKVTFTSGLESTTLPLYVAVTLGLQAYFRSRHLIARHSSAAERVAA